jgi:predicted oxidoreductase
MSIKTKLTEKGPLLSRIIFGTMKWGEWGANLTPKEMLSLIHQSHDLGVTTFDHADIYGHYTTEETFGKALASNPSLRQNIQLITKCGIRLLTPNRPFNKVHSYDTSRKHIILSLENSLRELRTDYIDLLLIHRPSPLMDPDEIAEAFTTLKEGGKVLHFGVSNFTPSQFEMLNSRIPLVTNQVEASILHLNPFLDGTFDQCLQHKISPMVWSPLGGGKVFTDLEDEQVIRIREVCEKIGKKHGNYQIDQVLIAWLLKHPSGILPVLGTSKISRIKDAIEALTLELTTEDWFEIWVASTGYPIP